MWKDITSYSRYDEEIIPTTYECKNDILKICITSGHINYRPQWIMHCYALGIDTLPLKKGINKEEAMNEAIKIIKNRITRLMDCAEALE